MSDVATRFAPSPSGHLHVGGARTALYCWAFARGRDGRFILRIEDTDQKRRSDAAIDGFMKDLAWLGIDWDEGPAHGSNGGGDHGPYLQSERLGIYADAIERLLSDGRAYYAFETAEELDGSRTDARREKREYRYDGRSKHLSREEAERRVAAGEPAVVRFRTPEGAVELSDGVLGEATVPAGEIDDFVIQKADGFPTYHFAVVVDDALMGVTHVLRAQEHFLNTAKHLMLQDALRYARPVYGHLSIIMNPDGSKMSKRDKDKVLRAALREKEITAPPKGVACTQETFARWIDDKTVQLELSELQELATHFEVVLPEINVADFRRSGYLPEVLCNFLALNGWNPGDDVEHFDNAFLAERFNLNRVQKAPAKFDRQKLLAFNHDGLQAMSPEEFAVAAGAHGREFHPEFVAALDPAQLEILLGASQARSKTLDDPFTSNRFLVEADVAIEWPISKPIRKAMFKGEVTGLDRLPELRKMLAELEPFEPGAIESALAAFAEAACDGKLGLAAQPLRIAVTGGPVSPPIHDTLAMLGKNSVLARIDRCIATLSAVEA
jgi:glutamyl-tRNA synthetase